VERLRLKRGQVLKTGSSEKSKVNGALKGHGFSRAERMLKMEWL
jgi:hypothetical protein